MLIWQSAKFWAFSFQDPITRQRRVAKTWGWCHLTQNKKLLRARVFLNSSKHFLTILVQKNRFLPFLTIFRPTWPLSTTHNSPGMDFDKKCQEIKNAQNCERNQIVCSDFTFHHIPKTRFFNVSTKWWGNFSFENRYQLKVDLSQSNKVCTEHFLTRAR